MYRLGIDIGGSKVNLGITRSSPSLDPLDENIDIVFKRTEKLRDKSVPSVLGQIKAILDPCMADNGIAYGDIKCCGIGVPGTVDKSGRLALKVPNLGWENADVADVFEELTGIRARLIQDSRAAAFGEYAAGNGRNREIVVCITLGTGLGTGIVMNGKVFEGGLGCAGELGHIPVVLDGRECGCGKRGCLEKYAAGMGLDITAREIYGENCSAADIFARVKTDDKAAAVVREAVSMLGNTLVAMVNLLSPNCILFSGGMSAQRELFVDPLIEYIGSHCYTSSSGEMPYMDIASLGADAPMIGAAMFQG